MDTFVAIGKATLKNGDSKHFQLATQDTVFKFMDLCLSDDEIVEASLTSYKKNSDDLITTKFKTNDKATD
ncbi:hypothetical protein [Caudoviricetes sp.]|nr:hypothetical protein [Caudoviricetes sp.]